MPSTRPASSPAAMLSFVLGDTGEVGSAAGVCTRIVGSSASRSTRSSATAVSRAGSGFSSSWRSRPGRVLSI